MKIDRYIKDLSKKLDDFSNGNGIERIKDDEYYIARGEPPPWFVYHSIAIYWREGKKQQDIN
ncbi:MAG TPA: hypothetical protein VH796_15585 [Nitrososphaeraceae archaeon]